MISQWGKGRSAGEEWSRSRHWLAYFLYNRHDRPRFDWTEPITQPTLPVAALTGLIQRLASPQAGMADVIRVAQERHHHDPAFVQTLRLFDRERQHHHDQLVRLLARHQPGATLSPISQRRKAITASWLGMRYVLASLLLDDLIDVGLIQQIHHHWPDTPGRMTCELLLRDKAMHVTFLSERLTMEYADFNFARRSLRRWRLTGLFLEHLRRVLVQDRAVLAMTGMPASRFAWQSWHRFASVLETMVPYRRDALLAMLMTQRDKPYDRTCHPTMGAILST